MANFDDAETPQSTTSPLPKYTKTLNSDLSSLADQTRQFVKPINWSTRWFGCKATLQDVEPAQSRFDHPQSGRCRCSTVVGTPSIAPARREFDKGLEDSMADEELLPKVRPDLTVKRLSDQEFVVKLRARREYFRVGPEEGFLLEALQQPQTQSSLIDAFFARFGEKLATTDVQDFLGLAIGRKLLVEAGNGQESAAVEEDDGDILSTTKQSVLYYRVKLFNPDDTFTRWECRLRWIWTKGFLYFTLSGMLFALLILLSNRDDLVTSFPAAMGWETVLVAGALILATTALHEIAHGLTCKHFGGEVHDTGLLFMFFMPCMYCNVSDAWIIPEKWKRLWITAAGGYCDLCTWAVSVFIWRLTVLDSLINYLALVALTICGSRGLVNFNPFMRLDGYYLLSDWLAIPNLRRRANDYWMEHLQCFLWGAARPPDIPARRVLLTYGMMTWSFALIFLYFLVQRLLKSSVKQLGTFGFVLSGLLLFMLVKRVFKGVFQNEFKTMITTRMTRTTIWGLGIGGLILGAFVIPARYYSSGSFEVRAGERHHVTSPVTAYVRKVFVTDGEVVQKGTPLLQLESPDLESQIKVKRSELDETEAVLRKLKAGQRPEEILAQEERIRRSEDWCELGRNELARARRRLEQELIGLDQRVSQAEVESRSAEIVYEESAKLHKLGALAGAELRSDKTKLEIFQSQFRQAEALRKARVEEGVGAAEADLRRREQELAETKSRLVLLNSGTRPEEIAAEEARRDRLTKEMTYLEERRSMLLVCAPFDGVIATARIQEQVGSLAAQGAPLCFVEDATQSFIEISVPEEEIVGLSPGQTVYLKARAVPFETFTATVDRIAPSTNPPAAPNEKSQPKLVVYCHLKDASGQFRTGMSGIGKIDQGWRTLGSITMIKAMRYLRTEFWW